MQQITQSHCNFDLFLRLLQLQGKITFGEQFKLYDDDTHVFLLMYAYFSQDHELCTIYDIDPSKGLFFSGPTGVGKTIHMRIARQLLGYKAIFKIKPCHEIALEYMQDGACILLYYGRNFVDRYDLGLAKQVYCFDDLGTEEEVKYYGTTSNVLGQIILMRYDLFQTQKIKSHFTSNLTAPQIEKFYGERVRSRLREMCNWVDYSGHTLDKRK